MICKRQDDIAYKKRSEGTIVDSLKFIFTDSMVIELDKKDREQNQFYINARYRQRPMS